MSYLAAWLRSADGVGDAAVLQRDDVVLLCHHPLCTACRDLSDDGGRREAIEGGDAFRGRTVLRWDVSRSAHYDVAKAAGVNDLPAYVLCGPRPRVVAVDSSGLG